MQETAPVLVTGGAGYIGSHVALALADRGYRVVVLDNLVTGFAAAVPDGATFVEGDVSDGALVAETLRRTGADSIIHLAGSLIVPESVTDPLKYYRNNVAASAALFETALANGVRHVLFSSTAAVYGIPEVQPLTEALPTRPINPYGRSKLMIEEMLADIAVAHDLNAGSLRYFNVAGADPDGRSGQSTREATHLIKVACQAALGIREDVKVFGTDFDTPDGTGVRDYIHVSDLAAAHVAGLEHLRARPDESFTLNCGYGRGFSVLEVLDAVDAVAGTPLKRVLADRRAGDPPTLIADNGALTATLDWTPQWDDLPTIVRHALAWEKRTLAAAA